MTNDDDRPRDRLYAPRLSKARRKHARALARVWRARARMERLVATMTMTVAEPRPIEPLEARRLWLGWLDSRLRDIEGPVH